MYLRVRGSGACSENSQAIVMNLRGFRHQARCSEAESFPLFEVNLSCSHSPITAVWREIWNAYDIAYDGLDETFLATTSLVNKDSLTTTAHRIARDDVVGEGNVMSGEASSLLSALFSQRLSVESGNEGVLLLLNAAHSNANDKCLLELVWSVGYLSMLIAGASLPTTFVRGVVLVEDLNDGVTTRELYHKFTEDIIRNILGSSAELKVSWASSWRDVAHVASLHLTSSGVIVAHMTVDSKELTSDAQTMLRGIAESLKVELAVLSVPVKSFMEAEVVAGTSLSEIALSKENMVLNFCPCCGHTDGPDGGCHGHQH